MTNFKMIVDLFDYLNKQEYFSKYKEIYPFSWRNLFDNSKSFVTLTKSFNEFKGGGEFIPFIMEEDTLIGVNLGKYIVIDWEVVHHFGEVRGGYYSTPQEVWEKVIKPEIDLYYKYLEEGGNHVKK